MENLDKSEYQDLKNHFNSVGVPVDGMEIFKGCDTVYSARRKSGAEPVENVLRLPGGTNLCFNAGGKFLGISTAFGRAWIERGATDG